MATFKLAIVGAGPAGCTLARLLLHKNVDVDISIFEAEEQVDARTQGGSTKDAKSSRGRPELDRIQLRYLLLESIDPNLIHWNHKVDSVLEVGGKYRLVFRGGQKAQDGFGLIINGEGCWSKVRKQLTDEIPFYSGISGVSFRISDPQTRCPDLYELVNRGSLFAFGDHKAITSQQINDGGRLSVSYWTVAPTDWVDKFKDKSSKDVGFHRQVCLEELHGWDPELRKLLEMADSHETSRPTIHASHRHNMDEQTRSHASRRRCARHDALCWRAKA